MTGVEEPRRGAARTLLGGMSWQTASQLIPLIFNLALTPWFITGLGPERYSIFLLVTAFTALISQFDGGIGPSAMRYFSIYASRDDRDSTTRLLLSVSSIIFAAGVLISVVAFRFSYEILGFFRVRSDFMPEAVFLLRTLTAIIAFILVRNLLNAVINSRQLFRFTSMAILAGYVVYIAGVSASIVYGWGLYGVAITMVVQQVAGSIITIPPALRYLARARPWHMSRADLGEFFGYAWKVQVTGLTVLLSSQKDQMAAGRLLSAQQSGPFGQGASFAGQLRMLPLNATYPMQALIGSEVTREGADQAVSKVERLQRIWVKAVVGWFGIAASAAWFAVAAWLPGMFELAAPVATALLVGGLFQLLNHVANLWALTLGNSSIEMRSTLVGLAVNVAVSVAAGLQFGMAGVIAGTVVGQLVATLFFAWMFKQRITVPLRGFLRDIPWLALIVGVAVTLGLEIWADGSLPDGALGLVVGGILGAPGFIIYLLMAFSRDEMKAAGAMFRRKSA